jgi:hypothetical protein
VAYPEVHFRCFYAKGRIERAHSHNPTIQACNVDMLAKLPWLGCWTPRARSVPKRREAWERAFPPRNALCGAISGHDCGEGSKPFVEQSNSDRIYLLFNKLWNRGTIESMHTQSHPCALSPRLQLKFLRAHLKMLGWT